MAMAANCREDDEWQLINDDGFVYKRKKRSCPFVAPSSSSSIPPTTPSDPELEHKNRRERKKTTLLKIRGSYQKEILQWEHLSNTLSSMQQNPSILQLPEPQQIHGATASAGQSSSVFCFPSEQFSDSTCRQLIDELLLKAEAQETIIEDAVNLCEIAEAIFRKKESQFKLLFAALPVWASSPRSLILSLCDD